MRKITGVITARLRSQRLPAKALKLLCGKTSLYHHVERLKSVGGLSGLYLATSKAPDNAPLIKEAERCGLKIYAGEEEDVVERYLAIGKTEKADALLRVGCDKPLFSIEMANQLASSYNGEDNLTIADKIGAGVGCEIVSTSAMETVHQNYRGTAITLYIKENKHKFKTRGINVDARLCRPEYRLALDTIEDYNLHSIIYNKLYRGKPIQLKEVYLFLDDNPEVANINKHVLEKNINTYIASLKDGPIFSIFKLDSGKYIARDASGRMVPYEEFIKISKDKASWSESNG